MPNREELNADLTLVEGVLQQLAATDEARVEAARAVETLAKAIAQRTGAAEGEVEEALTHVLINAGLQPPSTDGPPELPAMPTEKPSSSD